MKKAFTLAEVLITLGIIGIVAALTMPTLVSSYRKHVVETRLAKFYSVINQAIKLSEIDNGELAGWDSVPSADAAMDAWYDKYLANYLIDVKKVHNNQITGSQGNQLMDAAISLYFPDGSFLRIAAPSWYFFPNATDADIELGKINFIDEVNTKEHQAFSGRKYFVFSFSKTSGVIPYGAGVSESTLRNSASVGCKENVTNEQAYCAALIQLYGWKIPDDYPFKF